MLKISINAKWQLTAYNVACFGCFDQTQNLHHPAVNLIHLLWYLWSQCHLYMGRSGTSIITIIIKHTDHHAMSIINYKAAQSVNYCCLLQHACLYLLQYWYLLVENKRFWLEEPRLQAGVLHAKMIFIAITWCFRTSEFLNSDLSALFYRIWHTSGFESIILY